MRFLKYLSLIIAFTVLFSSSINEVSAKESSYYHEQYPYNEHDQAVHDGWKKHHVKRHYPYVSQKNYQQFWDKGTFPTVQDSINYHTRKHGYGRSQLQYTRDAVNFYERNKRLRYSTTLKDGSPGYRIKKGQQGGIWTKDGKILTYWD